MIRTFITNSRLINRWWLFFCSVIFIILGITPVQSLAHQSPNSLVFLDVSPDRVAMEIQLPIPELELAFGNNISKNPGTLIKRLGPQLEEYLQAHIHACMDKNHPWAVEIDELKMDKGKYIESGIDYWELVVHIILKPQAGENTRKFILDYDVIMHQVINHVALVAIRSDWETGSTGVTDEASVINWNIKDNVIYPLEVNLEKGSWWTGFKKMVVLGMNHIKEGTDHLLFLIVLLLPCMLFSKGKRWVQSGGTKNNFLRLLKIVTAFTIGHSATLLIGALEWLKVPAQPVEILIAFSILISAAHAIYPIFPGKETYVAAGFGLIHGLAFASVLANLDLGAGTMALTILGFNLGIELMQLFVIALIAPWQILLSKTPFYTWVRIPGAIVAAIAALAWIAERSSGNANFITLVITRASQYGWYCVMALATVAIMVSVWSRYHNKKSIAMD